jgi:hypothetical protein
MPEYSPVEIVRHASTLSILCGVLLIVFGILRSVRHFSPPRVQVVLPGATAISFWDTADTPLQQVPREMVMNADEMVDAALAGFDQGGFITIPSLTDQPTGRHRR